MGLAIGIGWYGREAREDRQPWRAGWALRRDWPDGGHDFFGFDWDGSGLLQRAARDGRFWARGPVRPVSYTTVRISWRDFFQHGRDRALCCAPDCPVPDPAAVALVVAR